MAITVAIIEPQPELRREFAQIVATDPECDCIGAGASWQVELGRIHPRVPDVVVLGLSLPDRQRLREISRLKQLLPKTKILISSVCEDNEHISHALRAGASGYLVQRTAPRELLRAVRNLSFTSSCPSP
ncbi:MAG TPA: response regulator transcription factor [Opitutaceae bacterium]|nr:response regulator transcription factor [Opitutaceae bacterium]